MIPCLVWKYFLEVPQCNIKVTLPWQKRRQLRILKRLSNTKTRDTDAQNAAIVLIWVWAHLAHALDILKFFKSFLLNYYAKPDLVFHKIPFSLLISGIFLDTHQLY